MKKSQISELDFVLVKANDNDNAFIKIFLKDIIAIEAQRNYVMIHLLSRRVKTYVSISEFGKYLSSFSYFVRLHRGFIVSTFQIKHIKRGQITMENGLYFMVGENYKNDLAKFINVHSLKNNQ